MWSGTDFHLLHEDRKGLWTRDTGEIFKERGGCMGSLKADPGYFSKKDRVGGGGQHIVLSGLLAPSNLCSGYVQGHSDL